MEKYIYRPKRFYLITFALTWGFWILALVFKNTPLLFPFMLLGLIMPAGTAVVTVMTSGNKSLKDDFKRKLFRFYKVRPLQILTAMAVFAAIVAASIGTSVLFGGSLSQFSFTEDFSFSIGGTSALLTIFLASTIEELGWRGYGEDAVGEYHSWFKESIIFGCIWACWHLPLFLIPGTYHYGLKEMGVVYVLNFLISTIPFDFIQTWVYVKNNRSMLATIIFHMFVNIMQEKIAMTPETKIIQTAFVLIAAVIIVLTNKKMFFEKDHIGNLLGYSNTDRKTDQSTVLRDNSAKTV
ncbi:MAG: CPBP family intramembrane metalloprotease [Lachnospiraceae bacterium]|nr:CPBP family intramembrane metalloprotease [Lachnospiraceae bacterium]